MQTKKINPHYILTENTQVKKKSFVFCLCRNSLFGKIRNDSLKKKKSKNENKCPTEGEHEEEFGYDAKPEELSMLIGHTENLQLCSTKPEKMHTQQNLQASGEPDPPGPESTC